MKKLLLVLFFVPCIFLSAKGKGEVLLLIADGLYKNQNIIEEKVDLLTDTERYEIQMMSKKRLFGNNCCFIFLGWGLGSYLEKDEEGGFWGLLGDSIGWGLYAGGGMLLISRLFQIIRPTIYSKEYNQKLLDILLKREQNKKQSFLDNIKFNVDFDRHKYEMCSSNSLIKENRNIELIISMDFPI